MNSITDGTEQLYLNYIEENKAFLKDFHRIYYNKYKEYLKGYNLSDYMITSYIKANKITDYNNYLEFIDKYLLQLSADKSEAIEVYNSFYDCFIENMSKYINPLKVKYNKTDNDIYTAYEIKTVWQFYVGFLNEKVLSYYLDYNSVYTVADRSLEDQKLIDAGLLDSNYKDEILKQSNKNLRATERVQVWYGSPLKKSHRIESYQLDGTFNFAITETSTLYVNSSKQIRVLVSLSNLNQGVATVTSKSTSNGNYVGTGSTSQGSATINYKLPSGKTYVANGTTADTWERLADTAYVDVSVNAVINTTLGGLKFAQLTQTAYDALGVKDPTTISKEIKRNRFIQKKKTKAILP